MRKSKNRSGTNPRLGWIVEICVLIACLAGCGPPAGESTEAKALAGTLMRYTPEAQQLLQRERDVANQMKIVFDVESWETTMTSPSFSAALASYIDTVGEIRQSRRRIAGTLDQGLWHSPFVNAVQNSAVTEMQYETTRSDSWLQLLGNIRTRLDLHRNDKPPEWDSLNKELDRYLAQTPEAPLSEETSNLEEEYRFGENQIKP